LTLNQVKKEKKKKKENAFFAKEKKTLCWPTDLLGSFRKYHASKGGRQGFRIHFASGTLKVVVLPPLRIR
jgi:hypothetical protein